MAEDFSTSNLNEAKFHASLMIRTVAFSTSDSVGALSSYVTAAAGAAFIAAISTGSSIAAALGANVLAAWLFTCVVTMVIGFAAKGAGTGVQAAKAAYEMGAKEADRLGGSASYDISPLPIDVQRLVLKAAPFGERWIARHTLAMDRYEGALSIALMSNLQKRLVFLQISVLLFGGGYISRMVWWVFEHGKIPGV
ncbi:hypothetical protein [Stenotrophomonas sp. TWI1409]|uniref:hypothetical protein n=1 Tax=unclassified Stenotrophomonas TaxID=196198 RepID=UPI003208D148